MMRRCAGFNTDEAWHQLLEECQDITSLQLAPDDHLAYRVDAVDLKNRLRDVETDRRDPVHAALLRIVVTPAATTSMALTCRWRSRPQHHNRTSAKVGALEFRASRDVEPNLSPQSPAPDWTMVCTANTCVVPAP